MTTRRCCSVMSGIRQVHRLPVLHPLDVGKIKEAWRLLRFFRAARGRWQPTTEKYTSALRLQVVAGLFFAASGNGNGSSWNNRGSNGNYWSASFNSARNARNLNFNSGGVNPQNNNNRYNGFAVRAVQHLSIPRKADA